MRPVERPAVLLAFVLAACGGSAPPPAAAPEPTPASPAPAPAPGASAPSPAESAAPPASAAPPPAPVPTGGSVLVGEIAAPPHFDPKPTLDAAKHDLLACYDKARQANPGLRGKLKLVITVNEAGAVTRVDGETGAPAYDPTLIACIGEALKAAHFPKPPGLATVTAPLVFRP